MKRNLLKILGISSFLLINTVAPQLGFAVTDAEFRQAAETIKSLQSQIHILQNTTRNQKLVLDIVPTLLEKEKTLQKDFEKALTQRMSKLEDNFKDKVLLKTVGYSKELEEQVDRLTRLIARKNSKLQHQELKQNVNLMNSKMKKFVLKRFQKAAQNEGFIGEIRYSILDELQFLNLYGPNWVLMAGQSIEGTELEQLSGLSTVPDSRGQFLRCSNSGRTDMHGNPDGDLEVGMSQMDQVGGGVIITDRTNDGHKGNPYIQDSSTGTKVVSFRSKGNETRPRCTIVHAYIKIRDNRQNERGH